MSRKSRWIETELEHRGNIYFVPLRCCLEVRKNRLRTLIQFHQEGRWVTDHRTEWTPTPDAHRLTQSQLDEAAGRIADLLIDRVEDQLIEVRYD